MELCTWMGYAPYGSKHQYRWTWIWRTQWDQENWSVICKIRHIHMANTMHGTGTKHLVRHRQIIRLTVVRHIQVHLYINKVSNSNSHAITPQKLNSVTLKLKSYNNTNTNNNINNNNNNNNNNDNNKIVTYKALYPLKCSRPCHII